MITESAKRHIESAPIKLEIPASRPDEITGMVRPLSLNKEWDRAFVRSRVRRQFAKAGMDAPKWIDSMFA